MNQTLRKAGAEFVATLLFVFAIVGAINASGAFAPLVIGFALMVLVYGIGHISGGHLNPAVSFGAAIRGAISWGDFVAYVIAQLIGGALGALLSLLIFDRPATGMNPDIMPAFWGELIFTFVLVFVVLNTATSKDHPGNSFYGLAIGTVVFIGAATVGGVSGGAFNPAVAFGLGVGGYFDWAAMWMWFVAALIGGALAAIVFMVLNSHDKLKAGEAA